MKYLKEKLTAIAAACILAACVLVGGAGFLALSWSGRIDGKSAAIILVTALVTLIVLAAVAALWIKRTIAPLSGLLGSMAEIWRQTGKGREKIGENLEEMTAFLRQRIESLSDLAYRDAMTGVKSKTAYLQAVEAMDRRIREENVQFGVVMADVNFLKQINDTYGHDMGDRLIIQGCQLLCKVFQHSPVYRFGGDEFVAILEREDLENREALMQLLDQRVEAHNAEGKNAFTVSLSLGLAVYDPAMDKSYSDVFKRADEMMYAHKRSIKGE